jgi:formylglycine-generating enzyme
MNKTRKGFMAAAILLIFQLIFFSCGDEPGDKTVPGDKKDSSSQPESYTIVIDISDNVEGDTVTVSPAAGKEGDNVTLSYTIANTKSSNLLEFSGVNSSIASADNAGSGDRTYTIDAADAYNGIITILAIFTHTDLELDHIAFTDSEGHITKIYGDTFTNAVAAGYNGSGAITYSSSNTTIATVNNFGQVTIHKVGETTITAEKAADTVYAHAQAEYTLMVNPKPVTVTVNVNNKTYDGTVTATGTAVINGKITDDDVTAVGTAVFADKNVGTGKTVTFSGYSLTGADAGNYTLSAQPESATADILSMIEVVSIPAGAFRMGSPATESGRVAATASGEVQHQVTLTKSFYMSTYQVTQAQYRVVMGAGEDRTTDQYGKGDNYPVYSVSWYDALVFCNKLSVMEGLDPVYSIDDETDPAKWGAINTTSNNNTWDAAVMDRSKNGYRLPTEAEWEYACRGDYENKATVTATIPFGIGTDGRKMISGMANFDGKNPYDLAQSGAYEDSSGTKLGRTTEVGSYTANNYGLYDMHGNVYEWCWDRPGTFTATAQTDPTGGTSGGTRIYRGGDFLDGGRYLRSACRKGSEPYNRGGVSYSGIRLVKAAD